MRPEDHIDENYVPTEKDSAPEQVDEKEQLLQSIKKGCRVNTIFYIIMGILFLINGIVHLNAVSDSKLYLCPLIALMLVSAIVMVFYALIYDRIRRASTAREMKHFLDLTGANTVYSKLILITMTLCIMVAAILGLIDKTPWYVIVLVVIGIAAIISGVWWLIKRYGKGDSRDIEIERLLAIEEQENRDEA
ncbi:MAG: hypothetical protein IJK93_10840 [Muribaculaceae bacterium]|nr:hypothetical protein [Muribaculaceae bacterium]